jgi:hypothetical protein
MCCNGRIESLSSPALSHSHRLNWVSLVPCRLIWVTVISCIACFKSFSCAVSVELSHSHVLYRLNWVTLMCCIGWIESRSCAVSVELSHSHVLYRLNWAILISCIGCFKSLSSAVSVALFALRYLLCRLHSLNLANSTLSAVLIVLCLFYFSWQVNCMPSFSITFDTTHPTWTYFNFFQFLLPNLLLGAFVKLRKASISFVISVCLTVSPSAWNNSVLTEQGFVKFEIWALLENLQR